jgi:tripartite ATP-independent transporter DctP family solute receptor
MEEHLMKLNKICIVIASAAMLLSNVACGNTATKTVAEVSNTPVQQAPTAGAQVFTIAHDSPEDTVTHLFTLKFIELAKEKSNGTIDFQLFPSGQMGSDTQILESLQRGDLDFAVQNTAPQVNFIPKLAVFDLPSVFPNEEVARKTFDSPFLDLMKKEYEGAGFKLFGYADQGFRVMSTNKKVENINDFKGQKIRTMENKYHMAFWSALGANPSPMAFAEVYIALQQGTIDAQENPYEVIVSNKLYEQQKYVVNTNHILHIISLVGNNSKFNALPQDTQTILLDASQEAIVWARAEADKRKADRISIMEGSGTQMITPSPELAAEMVAKSQVVYDQIKTAVGDDLYNGLLDAVNAAK